MNVRKRAPSTVGTHRVGVMERRVVDVKAPAKAIDLGRTKQSIYASA